MNGFRHARLALATGTIILFTSLASIAAAAAGSQPHTSAASDPIVKTAAAHILVTNQGMTLYVLATDSKNKSTCTGGCAKFWPPLVVPKGILQTSATIAGIAGTLGAAPRTEGTRQVTYDGEPLYTFSKDKKPGDMNGQGVGGVWWVVVAPVALSTTLPLHPQAAGSATSTPSATPTLVPPTATVAPAQVPATSTVQPTAVPPTPTLTPAPAVPTATAVPPTPMPTTAPPPMPVPTATYSYGY